MRIPQASGSCPFGFWGCEARADHRHGEPRELPQSGIGDVETGSHAIGILANGNAPECVAAVLGHRVHIEAAALAVG